MITRFTAAFIALVLLASSSAYAGPSTARRITYDNTNELLTPAGRSVHSVQQALDSLSQPLAAVLNKRGIVATVWEGSLYDSRDNDLRRTPISVTFTRVTSDSGTWTSLPFNIFRPGDQLLSSSVSGTWSGIYTIVGDTILATAIRNPNAELQTIGGALTGTMQGRKLTLRAANFDPPLVMVLGRQ